MDTRGRRSWRARRGAPGLAALLILAGAAASGAAAPAPAAATSAKPSIRRGDVKSFMIPDRHKGRERRVWVYTPPAPASARDSTYGLVVAFDGGEYLDEVPLPRVLDSLLAAGRIPPLVALLVDDSTGADRLDDLANRKWFVDFLADEVLPWLRRGWRVTLDPHRVIVTGSSAGGLAAAHAGLRRPDLFGNVLSQSGAFWRGAEASNDAPYEWLSAQVATWPRGDVNFWLEVGSTETRGALGGSAPSILAANRALRDALRKKGYRLTYTEVPNGVHAPQTWAVRLPVGLEALAGPPAR